MKELQIKKMDFHELFTNADKNGIRRTKVEMNIIDGDGNNKGVYAKNAPLIDFRFRGFTIEQIKGKKINVFVRDTLHILDDIAD